MKVVDAIAKAITGVPGALLFDSRSDADHNRSSVLTFAGPPAAVSQAAFEAIVTAAKLIDMEQHEGAHPRMGATDVVPFVPLGGSRWTSASRWRALSQRVGTESEIPVY